MSTDAARIGIVDRLVAGCQSGHYDLPEEVTEAYGRHRAAQAITVEPGPAASAPEQQARALLDDLAAGKPADPLARAGQAAADKETEQRHATAARMVREAQRLAAEDAVQAVAAHAEPIITEHLAASFEQILGAGQADAKELRGFDPNDAHTLLTAPDRTRKSYLRLKDLAGRLEVLWTVRAQLCRLAGLTPSHDGEGLFVVLRRPQELWGPMAPTARPPRILQPAEPVARLLWLLTEAAPALPWFPTPDQADHAWQESPLGERHREWQSNQHSARAFAALGR